MEAVAWTAISILAVALFGLGTLFFVGYQHLSDRIDAQGSDLGAHIDRLGIELRAEIRDFGRRLDRHIDMHP